MEENEAELFERSEKKRFTWINYQLLWSLLQESDRQSSCLSQVNSKKSATCYHVRDRETKRISESETSDFAEEGVSELKCLRLQVKLLNEPLRESRSKNEVFWRIIVSY